MINVLVCVKQVVDVSQLKTSDGSIQEAMQHAPRKISEFDLNALEEAIRLKEKHGGKVTVLSVGSDVKPMLIKEALAMGADEAYVVSDPEMEGSDGLVTAMVLAEMVRRIKGWDIILCGEASSDEAGYQVGPRLAKELGIPFLAHVTKLELKSGKLLAERALENIVETYDVPLPALFTVGLEINTPRIPSLLMIKASSKKPITYWSLKDLEITVKPALRTIEMKVVKSERKNILIEGNPEEVAEKLVTMLLKEGVIKG
ncbi:MAG: electron transfer flavoprotein subunit beta/FixA family protein [Nitrososphaerota archaeon]